MFTHIYRPLSLLTLFYMTIGAAMANSLPLIVEGSYAEEYRNLRVLLESVTDTKSAKQYKPAIEKEIQQLNISQPSGEEYFKSLSAADKKLFVKRFQQNRFHCGEVTQVMVERRRILFDPQLSKILAETLANIP